MIHETLIDSIKETFLAHVPDDDLEDDDLATVSAYTVAFFEEKNIPLTPENISKYAEEIKAYMDEEDVPAVVQEENTILKRVEKLEKLTKQLSAFGWVMLAGAFLFIFMVGPRSKTV